MISEDDKSTILELAKKYKVGGIFLFGSGITSKNPTDIDLAVEGILPEKNFSFYG